MTSQAKITTCRDRYRSRCCWCFSVRVLRVDTSSRPVSVSMIANTISALMKEPAVAKTVSLEVQLKRYLVGG